MSRSRGPALLCFAALIAGGCDCSRPYVSDCFDDDQDGAYCDDCDDADPLKHPGAAEVCDAKDNDCNGAVDDAVVDAPPCALTQGICSGTVKQCVSGRYVECSDQYGPLFTFDEASPALCNGIDDDCDGQVDEDFDLQSDPSHCGACNEPVQVVNAAPACVGGKPSRGPCAAGYYDLDARATPGCEALCDLTGCTLGNGLVPPVVPDSRLTPETGAVAFEWVSAGALGPLTPDFRDANSMGRGPNQVVVSRSATHIAIGVLGQSSPVGEVQVSSEYIHYGGFVRPEAK
jgi:hypothetical protein